MSQNYSGKTDASSAGAVLAAAREELNLSIAEVARHLKLSPAQVEALEAGAYDRLPGRVFVRGFLRNYAKLLGIDPEPLLRRIEHELPQPAAVEEPPPPPEEVMPTGERSRWPVYAGVAGVIIAALAAYEFGFNSPPPTDNERSVTPDTAMAPAESARPPGTHELHFQFDQESWVEVRDANDKVIFTRLNRAGSEERVTGAAPLKLVVGNARGVRLTYDGAAVDLTPHTGVTVARLTLK
jgi:cytoskeleton protein RodZ